MTRFYIALLSNYFQDLRSAIGPFESAEEAARWATELVARHGGTQDAPRELAAIGDWFAMEVNCTPQKFNERGCFGISTVLGPFKSRSSATRGMNREIKEGGDATFVSGGDHFVAQVRYMKQHESGMQIAVFER